MSDRIVDGGQGRSRDRLQHHARSACRRSVKSAGHDCSRYCPTAGLSRHPLDPQQVR